MHLAGTFPRFSRGATHLLALSTSSREYPVFPIAAVAVTVVTTGPPHRYLLVQRANEPAKGQWSVPGGIINVGEETMAAAARELFEETALSHRDVSFSPTPFTATDAIYPDTNGATRYHYVIAQVATKGRGQGGGGKSGRKSQPHRHPSVCPSLCILINNWINLFAGPCLRRPRRCGACARRRRCGGHRMVHNRRDDDAGAPCGASHAPHCTRGQRTRGRRSTERERRRAHSTWRGAVRKTSQALWVAPSISSSGRVGMFRPWMRQS